MISADSRFSRMQGARVRETGVYILVHEDFANPTQRRSRLEARIRCGS